MAVRGTCVMFQEAMKYFAEGDIDISSDTFKLGIIDDTLIPAADDTSPTWSDYSTNEVATTGNYTANGETLTTVTSAMVSGIYTMGADDVNIAMNASGFTDGAYGIVYESVSDLAIGFVQLDDPDGNPVNEQAGPVDIEWPGGVVLRLPANALTWETP
jgi:hypothetical protein